jgi:anthranilate phosphoribosyltransferase
VAHERRDPRDEKFARCRPGDLAGGDASFNACCLREVLSGGTRGAHYDALVLGASLALEVTGTAASRRAAIAQVREAINAGRGGELLGALADGGAR